MGRVGKCKKRRAGTLILLIFFALGLAGLALPELAESRVIKGGVATAWVRRYRGPHDYNGISALAVDGQGNVYVTGGSLKPPGNISDYLTIKYNPDGQMLWGKVYNGPENFADHATALAVDGQGNVYVTGNSVLWGQDSDYSLIATIKYNADGQPLWVQRYDEPPGVNAASAIAVDGQGNVYVTGSATIKYNPDGQELWVRRSPGGFTIKVDGQGNVYVTGSATVKYSPDGQEIWVRRFKGPGNGDDYATAMAVDGQGNVYVTGFSKGSGTGHDYATIKYSPNGQRLWLRRYNGPGNSSAEPSAIAVDGLGNVYVTGLSYVNGTSAYTTIKYSPDGQRLWVKRYAGPNGTSYANAITVDGHGNVYVTGEEYGGIATSWNCTTIKYRSDGRRLWIRRHNGPTNNADLASAIAVDGQGNVYISGRSYFSDDISDYLTIKYKQNP